MDPVALLKKHPAELLEHDVWVLEAWMSRPDRDWSPNQRELVDDWARSNLGSKPGKEWGLYGPRAYVHYLVRFCAPLLAAICARRAAGAAWAVLVFAEETHGLTAADRDALWRAFKRGLSDLKQDVLQDQIAYLYGGGLRTFDPTRARLESWIRLGFTRQARKAGRAEMRKRVPHMVPAARAVEHDAIDGELRAPRAERALQDQELLAEYSDCLSPLEREAVQLLVIDGLSVDEAASRAGCSKSAITVRLFRARQRLKREAKARKKLPIGGLDHD